MGSVASGEEEKTEEATTTTSSVAALDVALHPTSLRCLLTLPALAEEDSPTLPPWQSAMRPGLLKKQQFNFKLDKSFGSYCWRGAPMLCPVAVRP